MIDTSEFLLARYVNPAFHSLVAFVLICSIEKNYFAN